MSESRPGGPWQRGTVTEHGAVEWTCPVHPASVRFARRMVRTMCVFWRASDACDAAVLAVSELVGNAVKATVGGEVTLRLAWTPRRLRVEVVDAAPGTPQVRQAADTDEGGRGLWLLSQLAVRWGVEPRTPGKCVWAEIALPSAA